MSKQRRWVRRTAGLFSAGAVMGSTFVALVATAPPAAAESVYVVNSTLDTTDTALGDGVCATAALVCTLRAAIAEAKEGPNNVPVRINFNIPGPGVQTITLGSQLPDIGQWDPPMTIDGYTQPGASPNTDPLVSNAVLRIHVRGNSDTSGFIGIRISGDGNVVRGLAMTRLFVKIQLIHPSATGNVIAGNFIGTDPAGTYKASTRSTYANGIELYNGAHSNSIGEPTPAGRNVVSGNAGHGIALYRPGTDENQVVNNIVGLNPSGTDDVANRVEGIDVNRDASYNVIGGFDPYERNLVSGNATGGIEISHNSGTVGNMVLGNLVGTDKTGTRALSYTANGDAGVKLEDGASHTLVDGNVVGNSSGAGNAITVQGFNYVTTGNVIRNNRIGVSLDGRNLGGRNGIRIANVADHTLVQNNIIAGHMNNGVQIDFQNGNDFNTITGNSIYGNTGLGIDIYPWGVNENDPGDGDVGPNDRLNFPEFTATTTKAVGTACSGCTVEVFRADAAAGEYGDGQTFLASATATIAGDFEAALLGLVSEGDVVTTTATDPTGNTSEFSVDVSVVSAPNEPPVAVVGTASCSGLICSLDGSASYDADGTVTDWSWDFGDATGDHGPAVSHDYAAEGQYTVTLTVTDDEGATGSTTVDVFPAPTFPVLVASDGFARTIAGSWGTADMGGTYAYLPGQAPSFSVAGSKGKMAVPPGGLESRRTWLNGVNVADVDAAVTVNFDRAPVGGYGQSVSLQVRRVATNTAYRGRVRFASDGTVRVAAVKVVGAAGEVILGSDVLVPGLIAEPGVDYRLRAQVVGTNPATIRVKVWRVDQPEPTFWQIVRTDSEPVLQTSGSVGLHAYVGSGTSVGVNFVFDDLTVGSN